MKIEIQLIPSPPGDQTLSKKVVVVMDVLRATSVMVHALSQGALEIVPVATVEEAFQKAGTFPEGTTLLGGERNSRKIEGFDLGNSPREYISEKVSGKRLILTTTNGTRAFHFVSSGEKVLVGSFLNIGAVARRCLDLDKDLLLFPSGDGGNFSLEDTVCGGMLIDQIASEREGVELTDASRAARLLYQRFKGNLLEALYLSCHGKDLVAKGFEADLSFCVQPDIIGIVPMFQNGLIRSH